MPTPTPGSAAGGGGSRNPAAAKPCGAPVVMSGGGRFFFFFEDALLFLRVIGIEVDISLEAEDKEAAGVGSSLGGEYRGGEVSPGICLFGAFVVGICCLGGEYGGGE